MRIRNFKFYVITVCLLLLILGCSSSPKLSQSTGKYGDLYDGQARILHEAVGQRSEDTAANTMTRGD